MQNIFPQLRQDLITGAWTLVAPGRANRSEPVAPTKKRSVTPIETCPFEDISQIAPAPTTIVGGKDQWRLLIAPNKFPALSHDNTCPVKVSKGLRTYMPAVGTHSILLTRDHNQPLSQLSAPAAAEMLETLRAYSHDGAKDPCCEYISIFQNWGESAGASQAHPHLQMLALPVVPPGVQHSLDGSAAYQKQTGNCAHCDIIAEELAAAQRLVYENEGAIVISPYAASHAYELRIYPRQHTPEFAAAPEIQLRAVGEALLFALSRLKIRLNDPDYNLFIHTAPAKNPNLFSHYHWHIEILPKTNVLAGFDLGTGIVINPVSPESAAEFLR